MRLGIAMALKHDTPQEWAEKHHRLGLRAVVFPLNHTAPEKQIDAYAGACRDYGLTIAEVGVWKNPMSPDPAERKKNIEYCKNQLRLADRIGANCCVNITGSAGEQWDGGYLRNYDPSFQDSVVETIREIVDGVRPERTFYTLEPMPWMLPYSPENYLELLRKIDRKTVAVHLDAVNMISSPEKYFFNGNFLETCFRLLGPQIKSCHVKDVRLEPFLTFNLKETFCGNGNLDIRKYAELAHRCDPEMPFLIEHLHTEEEYLAAIRYVQSIIND